VGFEVGGGTSGDELGIGGDVGGAGVCWVQATVIAATATVASVNLFRFMIRTPSKGVD
jgi:hypothetical protein